MSMFDDPGANSAFGNGPEGPLAQLLRMYQGYDVPQQPPPSIQFGADGALQQWLERMKALGGPAAAPTPASPQQMTAPAPLAPPMAPPMAKATPAPPPPSLAAAAPAAPTRAPPLTPTPAAAPAGPALAPATPATPIGLAPSAAPTRAPPLTQTPPPAPAPSIMPKPLPAAAPAPPPMVPKPPAPAPVPAPAVPAPVPPPAPGPGPAPMSLAPAQQSIVDAFGGPASKRYGEITGGKDLMADFRAAWGHPVAQMSTALRLKTAMADPQLAPYIARAQSAFGKAYPGVGFESAFYNGKPGIDELMRLMVPQ